MYNAKELSAAFAKYLAEQSQTLGDQKEPKSLYDIIKYTLDIGGKRIRPILLLMAHNLYSEDLSQAMPAAVGLELFHNFTLLHDDIMDDAELRRGQTSVYKKFGQNSAILSGDVMAIQSYQYLCMIDSPHLKQILFRFNEVAIQICEGQQYDIDFESQEDTKIEDYLLMIEQKTAILLGLALEMGGILGEAPLADQQHLFNYGKNLGIAFQIQDDILDTFGDEEQFGKSKGGDIVQGKKTYLFLKSKELLGDKEAHEYNAVYNDRSMDKAEKIQKVTKYFNETHVIEYAKQLKDAYVDLAHSHLEAIKVDSTKKTTLRELSKSLQSRKV